MKCLINAMARRPQVIVSYNMSRVKSKNTGIERTMLSLIKRARLTGYRRNDVTVYGKPISWEVLDAISGVREWTRELRFLREKKGMKIVWNGKAKTYTYTGQEVSA